MKLWIKTKIVGSGTAEDPRRAYIPTDNINCVMMEIDDNTCLCRIAGHPDEIKTILSDPNITVVTDAEALDIIKSKNKYFELEDLDVTDPELEELARSEGLDPHEIKRDVQVPTRGKRVLQCQEAHLLRVLAKKKGIDISDIEEHIELGSKHAHNRALARLRGAAGIRDIYKSA